MEPFRVPGAHSDRVSSPEGPRARFSRGFSVHLEPGVPQCPGMPRTLLRIYTRVNPRIICAAIPSRPARFSASCDETASVRNSFVCSFDVFTTFFELSRGPPAPNRASPTAFHLSLAPCRLPLAACSLPLRASRFPLAAYRLLLVA